MWRCRTCNESALGACSSWRPVAKHERWTLFEQGGQTVSADRYAAAFDPAFQAVEEVLGPFEGHVAVHAWGKGSDPAGGHLHAGVHQVPGIGPARIQAYHARGGGAFGRSGVFFIELANCSNSFCN